ncbi:MAG: DUF3276 family protein [Runella slithyformis]|nr:MAG: DUF3276 family protein [Runella slithyformis]TAF94391.1 MAG: DUF3276 family protein [Runella sp.]TAG18042.1 MAG: DUF3276 family protein [Cytophagales bacterium]TAG37591.1 MAG: DUF3276 family protein [Cytophagia bacterium]TAE99379.1 MAG: DUF3276 family protein [Runella slithyformis]
MEDKGQERIYSNRVKAGKRTYFFDVRATRSNDFYLTITESRRFPQGDGFGYDKQKMFLYKEDFDKFIEALQDTINHVKTELMPEVDFAQFNTSPEQENLGGSDLKWD